MIARDLCHAARVPEEQTANIVEAACLAAAIRVKAQGRRADHPVPIGQSAGEPNVAGEAAFLRRVARSYERSALLPAMLTRVAEEGWFEPRRVERLAG